MLSSVLMLPHGAEIVPTPGRSYNEGFRLLHDAMQQAGRAIAERNTTLVILLTPHGYSLANSYIVYLHERFQGLLYDLSESNVYGEIASRAIWPGDHAAAEGLLAALQAKQIPVEGLIHGSATYPLTLGWAESVPLHYLVTDAGPRVLIVALPRRRFEHLADMQDDLVKIAQVFLDTANSHPGNVSICVSADLSHTHTAQGPYGVHASSGIFDRLVQEWAQTPTEESLGKLLSLQPTALACGMAGLRVLQTILAASHLRFVAGTYAVPTYFGMMVAQWS